MDGTTPEKKIPSQLPPPGSAVPAPGSATPKPASPSAPGSAIPQLDAPSVMPPGGAVPTPGQSPAAPGGASPSPTSPVAPGAVVPSPGSAVPTPGLAAPGTAVPPPGKTAAPATALPGLAAPGSAVASPGIQAPGAPISVPGAPIAPTVFPDAEKKQRTDEAGNPKNPLPLRLRLARPITRKQWLATLSLIALGILIFAVAAVLIVRSFMDTAWMSDFVEKYPGKYANPDGAPIGIPAWLSWQHFLNMFFMVLIIRTGIQINRTRRPSGFWTPKRGGKKISLTLWLHLALDLFWIINGIVFYILIFATGQWMRIVPTSWEVFPNALSAGLQYVSLNWPTETGWVNYNSLQELVYFCTVFIAAPLSIISGFRMSIYWPQKNRVLNRLLPIQRARAIHMPVMIYYIVFVIIHVFLVLATGALKNLNHMYGGQQAENWTGFWIFFASLLVIVGGVVAARPSIIAPLARKFGTVTAR